MSAKISASHARDHSSFSICTAQRKSRSAAHELEIHGMIFTCLDSMLPSRAQSTPSMAFRRSAMPGRRARPRARMPRRRHGHYYATCRKRRRQALRSKREIDARDDALRIIHIARRYYYGFIAMKPTVMSFDNNATILVRRTRYSRAD